ncbi:MAG: hypothetical protein ACLFRG_21355 [Desulfococcaceae bacterium]
MIAVDTNVIAALVLPTSQNTESAEKLLDYDRYWVAPPLWRSENLPTSSRPAFETGGST